MTGKVKDIIKRLSQFDPEEKMFITYYCESDVMNDVIERLEEDSYVVEDEELLTEEQVEQFKENPKLFITEDIVEEVLTNMSNYLYDKDEISEAWSEITLEAYGSALQLQRNLKEEQSLWELDDPRNEKL